MLTLRLAPACARALQRGRPTSRGRKNAQKLVGVAKAVVPLFFRRVFFFVLFSFAWTVDSSS